MQNEKYISKAYSLVDVIVPEFVVINITASLLPKTNEIMLPRFGDKAPLSRMEINASSKGVKVP